MSLLLLIAAVIVVLILALVAVDKMPIGEPILKQLLQVVFILIAIIIICQRAGLLAGLG